MVELIGYIGGGMLAICAIPQVIQCYKTKSAEGLNWGLLLLWFGGEVLTLYYVIMKHGMDLPLTINYLFNILLLTVIIRYKVKE